MSISFLIGAANPVYILIKDGIFYTLTGVLIPFVEKDSKTDLIINIIYALAVLICAGSGVIVIQVNCGIICHTVEVTADLSTNELNVLSTHLELNNLDGTNIDKRLIRIIQQIQTTDE